MRSAAGETSAAPVGGRENDAVLPPEAPGETVLRADPVNVQDDRGSATDARRGVCAVGRLLDPVGSGHEP